MRPDDLLARLAATLRGEIGPVVVDPFAKTQSFYGRGHPGETRPSARFGG